MQDDISGVAAVTPSASTPAADTAGRVVQLPSRDSAAAAAPLPPPDGAPSAPPGKGGSKKPPKARREADWGKVNGLLEHFSLIYGTDTAWDGRSCRIIRIAAMRLAYGNAEVGMWLAHRDRNQVMPENLVFEPGKVVPQNHINMWSGFELQPVKCTAKDVAPMLKLLNHLCSIAAPTLDEIDAVVEWILRWQALPLQEPGAKMRSCIVMHGPQGTGKNLYWDAWRDLFGTYGITVGQIEVEDKFNAWLSRKLAIVADEVMSRAELYHNKNRLKLVVTQEEKFPIRAMMQDTRWESNHANVVFCSNESQPVAIEDRDRRHVVIYTPTEADEELYKEVAVWLETGGLAKWMYYLLTYPLDGFSRHTKPPMTDAKEALIDLSLKPAQRFMREWLNGFVGLPMNVCSGEQLYRAFKRWAEQSGERYLPSQASFTRDAERVALERVDKDDKGRRLCAVLTYKVVGIKDPTGMRKSMRCWLPRGTGPLNGVTEGEWAAGGVEAFELSLNRFLRGSSREPEE